jgi:hypothetical protein
MYNANTSPLASNQCHTGRDGNSTLGTDGSNASARFVARALAALGPNEVELLNDAAVAILTALRSDFAGVAIGLPSPFSLAVACRDAAIMPAAINRKALPGESTPLLVASLDAMGVTARRVVVMVRSSGAGLRMGLCTDTVFDTGATGGGGSLALIAAAAISMRPSIGPVAVFRRDDIERRSCAVEQQHRNTQRRSITIQPWTQLIAADKQY